jgi:hypothetical protein
VNSQCPPAGANIECPPELLVPANQRLLPPHAPQQKRDPLGSLLRGGEFTMSRSVLALVGFLQFATSELVLGQVGTLDERSTYAIVSGASLRNQHGPIRAIILWHGAPGWNELKDSAERRQVENVFKLARLRAVETDKSIFGSWMWFGILDRSNDTVAVEKQSFPLVRRDSILVIMVTVSAPNSPRTVTTAFIGPDLPEDYWPKIWTSGDTTFSVHPRWSRQHAILLEALNRSPTVAAFLK